MVEYKPEKKRIKLPKTGIEVVLREPTVADQLAVGDIGSDSQRALTMISNLSGMSKDELMKLPLKDYEALAEGLESFL